MYRGVGGGDALCPNVVVILAFAMYARACPPRSFDTAREKRTSGAIDEDGRQHHHRDAARRGPGRKTEPWYPKERDVVTLGIEELVGQRQDFVVRPARD